MEPLSAVAMPDKKREAAAAKPVEEKPPKAKRGKAEAELVVPAVERPSQPSASPSPSLVPPVLRPELPPDDATESAVPVVTKIMEWAKPLVLKAMLEGKLGHGCSRRCATFGVEGPSADFDFAFGVDDFDFGDFDFGDFDFAFDFQGDMETGARVQIFGAPWAL